MVTWRRPEDDPVVAWGQVIAYLPEIRRMIRDGHSIVSLPHARLTKKQLGKAGDHLAIIAREEGRAVAEVRHHAEVAVRAALAERDELDRFHNTLETRGRAPSP